jgi:hypothetical protein
MAVDLVKKIEEFSPAASCKFSLEEFEELKLEKDNMAGCGSSNI